jgi:cell wall-associated NlpC family hydrolase
MAFTFTPLSDPTRIEVQDEGAWVATFTPGCYTVTLAGPERTFIEEFTRNGQTRRVEVTHATWVRAAPGPAPARVDERWLTRALAANAAGTADALGIAMQYLKGAPAVMEGDLQIAGDASYGPPDANGRRQERSDFNDYLGLTWLYPTDPADRPERKERHCLDCSGYMRMVWGYRHHLPGAGYLDTVPLSLRPRDGTTLPRRAVQQCASAPGLMLVANEGTQVTDFSRLGIGDLVFFDADTDDGAAIDHVGMYLGVDSAGHHRFISSRKTIDGPTFADVGGPSRLDGNGLYARTFRAVRRL